MNKKAKIILTLITVALLPVLLLACSGLGGEDINYPDVENMTVDETSVAESFLVSEFDISKVKINVKYIDTVDSMGSTVPGETKQISASLNMVKAEDKAKLSVAGTHTITLIYRKYIMTFTLTLINDVKPTYRVTFLDSDGNRLGDVVYVEFGGRAEPPALATKPNYTFIGWRDRDTGSMSGFDNIEKDTVLQATYAPNSYKVGFYSLAGNDEKLISEVTVPRGGNALDYAPEIPVISGYSNGRWENTEAMKNVSSDGLKFYALYDADSVSVTFSYMRFGTAMSSHVISYEVGTEIKNPPEASVEGFKFIEWRVNGKKVDFPYTVMTEMTFEAFYINITDGNEELEYIKTEGGVSISKYTGEENIVVIPNEVMYEGKMQPVVDIQSRAFHDRKVKEFIVSKDNKYFVTIDGVLFDKNVTRLWLYPELRSDFEYTVPDSVLSIEPYAFYGADNLITVNFGDKLTEIGPYAFAECINLTSVYIPYSVTKIGRDAFSADEGNSLQTITFAEDSVLYAIGDRAFYGSEDLQVIILPASLHDLGSNVFGACKSLIYIGAPDNPKFTVLNGALYSDDRNTLYAYPALYGSKPETGYGSLQNPEFIVDASCTEILEGCFDYARIGSIVIKSDAEVNPGAIQSPIVDRIYVEGNVRFYTESFGTFLPKIIIDEQKAKQDTIDDIRSRLIGFTIETYDTTTLEELKPFANDFIYETYRYIDDEDEIVGIRILGTRQTESVLAIRPTIGNLSVISIEQYAFYGDNFIEKIILPSDLLEIGRRAFSNMEKLTSITFNSVVKSIGDYAFTDSKYLYEVISDAEMNEVSYLGVAAFDGTAFYDKPDKFLTVGDILLKYKGYDLEITDMPEFIGYIATDAFKNHGEITKISFGENIRIIDKHAFQYCNGLVEVTFGSALTEIREQAFSHCSDLFVVNLGIGSGNEKLTIAEDAFYKTDRENGPVLVYGDSPRYTLTYITDTVGNSDSARGVVIVNPVTTYNTSRIRFAGWFTDSNYTELVQFPLELTEDSTIYAKWINISESSAGLQYRLTEDGNYAVHNYNGTDAYVIVPATYMGKPVVEIDDFAFAGTNLQQIELPNTVNYDSSISSNIVTMGKNVFDNTPWAKSYSGDFVTIDDLLVTYKGKLTEIHVPNTVKKIARGAFEGNEYVEKVVFPNEITELGNDLFAGCTALKEVVLPSNLLEIGYGVFKNCENLTTIDFSVCSGLSSVGYDAFDNTAWLNDQINPCVMINNILYKYIGKNATELHIYNEVLTIGERAFENNEELSTVFIPQSVATIGISAFENSHISAVNLYAGGSNLSLIQENAFRNAVYLSDLDLSVATKLAYIGEYAFAGCKSLKEVRIPSETAGIGAHAFEDSGLTNVTVSAVSKLTSISEYAFAECKSLYRVNFIGTSALVSIESHAFENCVSLRFFNNTEGRLRTIGYRAFYGCKSLSQLYINEATLTEIGEEALDSVGYKTDEKGFVTLGNILIRYEGYETEIEIPKNITTIYNNAFIGNTRIRKVTFPSDGALENINSMAFYGCENLEEINFPDTIRFVGNDVVTGTTWYNSQKRDGVEFIIISNTLIKYNGTDPKQVVIPESVQVINNGAFAGTAVFDITIGQNVQSIEEGAFDGIDVDTFKDWTITIMGITPPALKETSLLTAKYILIQERDGYTDSELKDVYRLSDGWNVQYDKVKIAKKHVLTYYVDPDQGVACDELGAEIEEEIMYALYFETGVRTVSEENGRSYIFVGWYLDEELENAVSYPLILNGDMTVYAKFIDNTTGSNGKDYFVTTEGNDSTIELYHGDKDGKIVIISEISDNAVTAIGSGWIRDKENATHSLNNGVYEPDSTENAEYRQVGAFEGHTELTEVYFALGSQIKVIGKNAFKGCTNLTKIVLPASITEIEEGAFEGCTSLKEIIFTGSCDGLRLKNGAFRNCVSLERVELPAGLIGLDGKVFEGCTKLKDIYAYADIAIAIDSTGETLPFEFTEGLRIHIKQSSMSSYSASWEAYVNYLVADIEEKEEE